MCRAQGYANSNPNPNAGSSEGVRGVGGQAVLTNPNLKSKTGSNARVRDVGG